MSISTVVALVLALLSTTITNLAYLREHDAAAALPTLSIRRPLHSLQLLLDDRRWMLGFAMESVGFLLYAAALSLGSLALVQSIGAGGIGVLAYVSARVSGRDLGKRELSGVIVSVVGLLALGVSLAGGKRWRPERLDRRDPRLARRDRRTCARRLAARAGAPWNRCRHRCRRRALLLDRGHLDESRHTGRRPGRLPRHSDPRLHARDRTAATRLPSRRRSHRRGTRNPVDQRAPDRGRIDRASRAGSLRGVRRPTGVGLRGGDCRRLPARGRQAAGFNALRSIGVRSRAERRAGIVGTPPFESGASRRGQP